jgi:2-polyprenyl-3-methyl-5-hydroxy-6-metoxy-1,4-benzoquinol methylase
MAQGGAALTPMTLMDTAWGFTRTQVLKSGVELDLFTEIDRGNDTLEALVRATGASDRGLRILLNALAGLQVLDKSEGRYQLTESGRTFLSRNSPAYMGEWLLHVNALMPAWAQLTEVVRTGKPSRQVEDGADKGEFFTKIVGGLFTMNRPGARAAANAVVGDRRGLRVLDVGAGSGVWGITFAERDPEARVTLVDYPKVLEIAKRFVGDHGMAERFTYVAGSFREVELGQADFDIAILGHICHAEGAENTQALLRRLHRALKPGGDLVIAEFLADEERRAATLPLLFAVNMLVNTEEGDTYTFAEMSAWLTECGFVNVRRLEVPGPSPLLLADRPA